MAVTRKPDYKLTCMDAEGNKSGQLGAAWRNEDGSIHLKLSPGVQLHNGLRCMLWPVEAVPETTQGPGDGRRRLHPGAAKASLTGGPGQRAGKTAQGFDDMDDDIPF